MLHTKQNFEFFSHFTYYVPGVADMFILLAWLLVGALLGNFLTLGLTAAMGPDAGMEYGTLVSYPVMFIPAMIYASIKSRNAGYKSSGLLVDSNNFGKSGFGICALVVAVATLALAFMTDAVNALMPAMPEWLETVLKSMTQGNLLINLLCVSVMAPLFEEWLCRGMVLRGLLGKGMKPVWAIVISAAFFALIHMNPWQAVPAFLLGCLFGYVYYRTGSLKLTMLMHCTNNTFAVICSNISGLEDMDNWQEVFPAAGYWTIFACCTVIVVLTVLFLRKIDLKSCKGNIDEVPSVFGE